MRKMKLEIPAWLWFSLYYKMDPKQKWNEEKEALALSIKKSLKNFLIQHDKWNPIITEPNNYDDHKGYMQKKDE